MEKRGVLKWIILLLVVALALTGCKKQEIVIVENQVLSAVIGEAGGVVEGFGGEVVLAVPPGALTERVEFFMYELNFKSAHFESGLLKTFVIEPFVTFDVPAKLTVVTNGYLSNGNTICEEMNVLFYIYDNANDYSASSGEDCISCCYEVTSHTISACIDKTGVVSTNGEMLAKQDDNITAK